MTSVEPIGRVPKVSIGLPVYNGEKYLEAALKSLLSQTLTDFELIICDNASIDRTGEIAERYARADSRIRYFREPQNTGAIRNHNRTIELARGKYFKWAAHDDVYAPTFVERCAAILDTTPDAVLAFSRTRFIDENSRETEDYRHPLDLGLPNRVRRFLQYIGATHILVEDYGLMRRDVLMKTPLLGNYVWSDMVLLGELSLYGRFVEAPEILFYRRLHDERAMQAHTDPKSLTVLNDPRKKSQRILPTWRLFGGHLSSLTRAPLSFSERAEILGGFARRANWHRRKLLSELLVATVGKSF